MTYKSGRLGPPPAAAPAAAAATPAATGSPTLAATRGLCLGWTSLQTISCCSAPREMAQSGVLCCGVLYLPLLLLLLLLLRPAAAPACWTLDASSSSLSFAGIPRTDIVACLAGCLPAALRCLQALEHGGAGQPCSLQGAPAARYEAGCGGRGLPALACLAGCAAACCCCLQPSCSLFKTSPVAACPPSHPPSCPSFPCLSPGSVGREQLPLLQPLLLCQLRRRPHRTPVEHRPRAAAAPVCRWVVGRAVGCADSEVMLHCDAAVSCAVALCSGSEPCLPACCSSFFRCLHQPLPLPAGHTSDVDVVRWHPNCHYIATGSSDRTGQHLPLLLP